MARTGKHTTFSELDGMHASRVVAHSNPNDVTLTIDDQMVVLTGFQMSTNYSPHANVKSIDFSGQGCIIEGQLEKHSLIGAKEVDEDERTELLVIIEQLGAYIADTQQHLARWRASHKLGELKRWYADVFDESVWPDIEVPE